MSALYRPIVLCQLNWFSRYNYEVLCNSQDSWVSRSGRLGSPGRRIWDGNCLGYKQFKDNSWSQYLWKGREESMTGQRGKRDCQSLERGLSQPRRELWSGVKSQASTFVAWHLGTLALTNAWQWGCHPLRWSSQCKEPLQRRGQEWELSCGHIKLAMPAGHPISTQIREPGNHGRVQSYAFGNLYHRDGVLSRKNEWDGLLSMVRMSETVQEWGWVGKKKWNRPKTGPSSLLWSKWEERRWPQQEKEKEQELSERWRGPWPDSCPRSQAEKVPQQDTQKNEGTRHTVSRMFHQRRLPGFFEPDPHQPASRLMWRLTERACTLASLWSVDKNPAHHFQNKPDILEGRLKGIEDVSKHSIRTVVLSSLFFWKHLF